MTASSRRPVSAPVAVAALMLVAGVLHLLFCASADRVAVGFEGQALLAAGAVALARPGQVAAAYRWVTERMWRRSLLEPWYALFGAEVCYRALAVNLGVVCLLGSVVCFAAASGLLM